jgi:hypothetical protein
LEDELMPTWNLLGRREKPPVVVLGCGPAGLFAAAAAEDAGRVVVIYSKKRRSEMFGAQYLHAQVPGLDCGRPQAVEYRLTGTVEQYRQKVYGADARVTVSPEALLGRAPAWDIRRAYWDAWERFADRIYEQDITTDWLERLLGDNSWQVVWSIPLQPQCVAGHTFSGMDVWAAGDAPARNVYCPVVVDPFTVQCNGEKSPAWYRASNVFGYRTAEWPSGSKPPIPTVARVVKPISTNSTCWTDPRWRAKVLLVGRYGRWSKDELSHQAYERTAQWLASR